MKKKIIFIIFVLFSLFLIGCQTPSTGNNGNDNQGTGESETTDFDEKFEVISNNIKESIPQFVSEDIVLIDEYPEYNATIEWSSSDEDVISFVGGVEPKKNEAVEITLTYKVMIGSEEKSDSINVIATPALPEEVADRFAKQFPNAGLIIRDFNLKNKYFELFEIDWTSSNTDVFTNEGKYIKPIEDTDIEVKYVVKCKDYTSSEYVIKLTAVGTSDLEKLAEISQWLKTEAVLDLYLSEGVSLPSVYEKFNVKINWKSTNPDVVSNDGKIKHYVFERYVTLVASYSLENGSGGSAKFECIVAPLDISKMSDAEILENFLSAIALENYEGVTFGGNGSGCNKTYGHLYFYLNQPADIDVDLIPTKYKNRTQIKQEVKLIVCHDTGNMNDTATAAANANYVRSGYGGSSTGWHYTVGNDGIFQTVPDDEVAYQANGSADQYTTYIKTNVKAQWKKPNFSVSEDGFIMINNVKSNIELPNKSVGLASDGPVWKIGEDGYYYIAKLWYCSSHNSNGTQGGNANAIGIESAVNNGSDYLLTCRIFAKLVSELAMKHNVSMNCIVQHNTTSGKDCPNAMRITNFWYTFKDYIALEIFAKTYLSDYVFTWTGYDDIDNTGRIKQGTNAKEVKYSVKVTKGSTVVLEKQFKTNINL